MVIAKRDKLAGYAFLLVAASGLCLGACNAILGIGEATVDPSLESDAGGDGGDTITCESYCALIKKNCAGANAEYLKDNVCLAMCATFDPGQPGEMTNDSLACRYYHAKQAEKDPVTECQKGGPLAGGGCTDPCSAFCLLDDSLCGAQQHFPYDGGVKECKEACKSYPYLLTADPPDAGDAGDAGPPGDIPFSSGDTLNCRLYHLESAYDSTNPDAVTHHCPHTGSNSATCN